MFVPHKRGWEVAEGRGRVNVWKEVRGGGGRRRAVDDKGVEGEVVDRKGMREGRGWEKG